MHRDVRWLQGQFNHFIALSQEHVAFFEDTGGDRPKFLNSVELNLHHEQDKFTAFDLSSLTDETLALGCTSGKVYISSVVVEPDIRSTSNMVELVNDIPKPVMLLDFSPIRTSYLSACFEGSRSQDYTVCVFDVTRPKFHVFRVNSAERVCDTTWFTDDSNILGIGCSRSIKYYDIRDGARPTYTIPVVSQVRSVSADPSGSFIACIIDDSACIFDRRHIASPLYKVQLSYFKKNDMGMVSIQWNPHYATSISCFRRNSRVVTELISPANHLSERDFGIEISAHPIRDGFDVQGIFRGIRYSEDITTIKAFHPFLEINHKFLGLQRISGYSWHPTERDRLLVVAPDSNKDLFDVRLATIKKFLSCDSAPHEYFAHAKDNSLYIRKLMPAESFSSTDISFVMKSRATKGYGTPTTTTLEAYIKSCKTIVEECPYANDDTKRLWKWLRHMITIVDWKPSVYGTLFPGVMDVMQHSLGADSEELSTERIVIVDPFLGRTRLYRGKERDRVLRVCGWPPLGEVGQLDLFIEENANDPVTQGRAVAAALFTANSARMKKALALIVEKSRRLNYEKYAEVGQFQKALLRYRGVPEQWKSISDNLRPSITDPYFNMIIAYLDSRYDNFNDLHGILRCDNIPLEDRIAFAALHFNDQVFLKSMRELYTEANLRKRLLGIIITGLSSEKATHDLLSEYVDDTGDAQTASVLLALGRCFVKEQILPASRSAEEIASLDLESMAADDGGIYIDLENYMHRSCAIVQDYLDMLNTWGLYVQRARFDCILGWRKDALLMNFSMEQMISQAEVCCQFCSNTIALDKSDIPAVSVSSAILAPTTRSSMSSNTDRSSSNVPAVTAREIACHYCLKPLPKCILCRRHMGSYVQSGCRELGRLSSWFTWCQKCRHGGHMAHLWHWFLKHDECAASGCTCRCRILDLDFLKSRPEMEELCFCCEDP